MGDQDNRAPAGGSEEHPPPLEALVSPATLVVEQPTISDVDTPKPKRRRASPPSDSRGEWEKPLVYVVLILLLVGVTGGAALMHIVPYQDLTSDLAKAGTATSSMPAALSAGCQFHFRANLHVLNAGFTIRLFATFFGAVVMVLGAMFVLYGARASYHLEVEAEEQKASLRTASPGLVMITLGAVISLGAVFKTQQYTLDSRACIPNAVPNEPDLIDPSLTEGRDDLLGPGATAPDAASASPAPTTD